MRTRFLIHTFVFACLISVAGRAQTAALGWSDVTRDVYINGDIDRAAQVMSADAPRRLAVISPRLDRAVILNVPEQTVSTAPKDSFRFAADRASATSDAGLALQPAGKYTAVDGSTYMFALDGKPVLIRPHAGVVGEMSREGLLEVVPVWRGLMESYQPAAEPVAALKGGDKAASVTIALGTWCPDSKNYVPRLLKALKASGNDKLRVKIVGIDSQFHEPIDAIQRHNIINVPTVIVERDGREIGRIIETPASESMEQDLAAILGGKPLTHPGRWDRGPRLARGAYSYNDPSGKEVGQEQWELFSTAEGGRLARSRITMGGQVTEVWHRVDARQRPTFVEVTKWLGDRMTRVRYRLSDKSMTARFRGGGPGVIEQTLAVPERLSVSIAVVTEGWGGDQGQATSYVAPWEFDGSVGALAGVAYEAKGEESVRVPAGEFRARRFLKKTDGATSEWWLHTELAIPVKGRAAGGIEYVLTSLDLAK